MARTRDDGKLCACGQPAKWHNSRCQQCINIRHRPKTLQKQNEQYRTDATFREAVKARVKARQDAMRAAGIKPQEQSPRHWLKHIMDGLARVNKQRIRPIEITVTVTELVEIWEKQQGRCAITGILMRTKTRTPYSASVDRIESSKAYTVDNVQLVCVAINYAKLTHSQEVIRQFVADIRNVPLLADGC